MTSPLRLTASEVMENEGVLAPSPSGSDTEVGLAGEFYIVSVWHTQRRHRYVTFWRPNDCGYAWPLSWAGRYPEEQVRSQLNCYNGGDRNIAVRAEAVEALAEPPRPGDIDGDAGPVVRNTAENWKALLAGVIEQPWDEPKPEYPRTRRAA